MLELALTATLALAPAAQQAADASALPVPVDLLQAIASELSGERAKAHVVEIAQHHRVQATAGYDSAAQYVAAVSKAMGLEDVQIHSYRSDGKTLYGTYQSPLSWTWNEAELRVVEPVDERLGRFPDIAMSLSTLSNGGEWAGELVHIGAGTRPDDYENVDVEGRIVLAHGYAGAVHRAAVIERGALGVVIYPSPSDRPQFPDMVRYNGLWPQWEERNRVTFGFQISRRQADRLLDWLRDGQRVAVEAWVDASLHPGQLEVVSATIPGIERPDETFYFTAHLDHPKPSANDNASGSGLLLEIARTIQALVSSGAINGPKRSITFLWVPEHFGTMAYLADHPELGRGALGGLNLDMVGEDLARTGAPLWIVQTPWSAPTYLNDLIPAVADWIRDADIEEPTGSGWPFAYMVRRYTSGSDHDMLNDPTIGVPAVALGFWDDWYHHTHYDTPAQVDPTSLKRVGVLSAAAALFAANAGGEEAARIGELVWVGATARLAALAAAAVGRATARDQATHARWLAFAVERERRALRSLDALGAEPRRQEEWASSLAEFGRLLGSRLGGLGGLAEVSGEVWETGPPTEQSPAVFGRPVRKFIGPFSDSYADVRFRQALGPERYGWYENPAIPNLSLIRYETINFMDGHRTIAEIGDLLDAEFRGVPLEVVERIVEDLARTGWVEIRE